MELNDVNSPSLNDSSLPPIPCCVHLACKSMMYRPDERPGLLHVSDTQHYWCNVTMDPRGPDDKHTNPNLCQPGRSCFRADEDE
jgi:hypothetical protein